MGTEVLQPQDLLSARDRVPPVPFHRRRNFVGNGKLTNLVVNRKGDTTVHRKASTNSDQKKLTEAKKLKSTEPRRISDSGLVMGQVTLLRRGESLNSLASKIKGEDAESTSPNQKPVEVLPVREPDPIEPVSPLVVPKQINMRALVDGYAGSAFYSSPSPRSVPVPSFFTKQQGHGKIESFDDSATNDLRRLLRLD